MDIREIQDIDGEIYDYDNDTPISIKNPWTGAPGEITKEEWEEEYSLEDLALLIEDELREHIHLQLAPCPEWDFVKALDQLISTEEFSRIVLGS